MFLYDNISHFRRRYPSHTDIRRFVEREHEAYRRRSALPPVDDNNNDTELYFTMGPWCVECNCHHFPHEKCLPPVRTRTDEWNIPAAAIIDANSADCQPPAAASNRTVVFAHRQLNPPPAAACARLTLDREAAPQTTAPDILTESVKEPLMTSSPPAVPSTSPVPPSPLYAVELHVPLATAIDAAVAKGQLPPLCKVMETITPFLRPRSTAASSPDNEELHQFIATTFSPEHHVFTETVALVMKPLICETIALRDAIRRSHLRVAERDRQIKALSDSSTPAACASTSTVGIDVCSDREFD
jgi:hypothetical protein